MGNIHSHVLGLSGTPKYRKYFLPIGDCISSQVQVKVDHTVGYNICQLPKGYFRHTQDYLNLVCVSVCVSLPHVCKMILKRFPLYFLCAYNKGNSFLYKQVDQKKSEPQSQILYSGD